MRTLEENQRQQEAARRFNAAMATAPAVFTVRRCPPEGSPTRNPARPTN